ncbi:MAG: hypothetical protein ISR65_19970 [Bacteriovoracaceae bacterium]|nr:hypothetical protein [Bacteriovoracaceae bacterium]
MKKNQTSLRPNFRTVTKALPYLIKLILKRDRLMASYQIKNHILERLRFDFPKDSMRDFFDKLPDTNEVGNKYLELDKKIAIMTYDDVFDEEILDYEKKIGGSSTFFLLSYMLKNNMENINSDLQIHFDKRYSLLEDQIKTFRNFVGKSPPLANRNHTLWWGYNQYEMMYLALNGIKIDSTLPGTKPFRLCVEGKLLPIWEVPFNVCDSKSVFSAPYNTASKMESLFSKNVSPVVGVFHPQSKTDSKWKDFYDLSKKHDYKLMTMADFYKFFLKGK